MSEVQVYVDTQGSPVLVGQLHRNPARGAELVSFEYADSWLVSPDRFALEPGLDLTPGRHYPSAGRKLFGAIVDSAPDTWGRQLLRRYERLTAGSEGRQARTLQELDYLLGVADIARVGALRFRRPGEEEFLAPTDSGVPSVVHLGALLEATDRTLRDEETEEDLRLILAPGSSLGGARPKASVVTADGKLAIAKFPKETDEYSLELWECVALSLARLAGIEVPRHQIVEVAGRRVLVVTRFDRNGQYRVPFLTAMAMLGHSDGEEASYLEFSDVLVEHGAQTDADTSQLFRRMAFNVLASNVDDHLRNHGFLYAGRNGWRLAPAYDLNPTPTDVRERRLTTNLTFDDASCDLDVLLDAGEQLGLSATRCGSIVKEVATATGKWREVAQQNRANRAEIERMASAFEHADLERALNLS